jgi:hypothetical protein
MRFSSSHYWVVEFVFRQAWNFWQLFAKLSGWFLLPSFQCIFSTWLAFWNGFRSIWKKHISVTSFLFEMPGMIKSI